MESIEVSPGQSVLLLWSGNLSPELLQTSVQQLKEKVGDGGKVQVENIERLSLCKYKGTKTYGSVWQSVKMQSNFGFIWIDDVRPSVHQHFG